MRLIKTMYFSSNQGAKHSNSTAIASICNAEQRRIVVFNLPLQDTRRVERKISENTVGTGALEPEQ